MSKPIDVEVIQFERRSIYYGPKVASFAAIVVVKEAAFLVETEVL